MKIWFDLSNAPHINLFKDLIRELQAENHEITVTCRPLSNTVALLDLHHIKYTIIGKHYGKSLFKKLIGYPIRIRQLQKFIKPLHIDIAISQSSFHSPVAARLLGIPSIYMNDNEYAMGNIPSFVCANKILVPEFLNIKKVRRQGAKAKKIIAYPGVKEGIYLWHHYLSGETNTLGSDPAKNIYIRPEPRTAQYYKGDENFLDELIIDLKKNYPIILLTRDEEQSNHYKKSQFNGVQVPVKPLSFEEIAGNCQLFIGAGGTMTREMAVIGIPTISVYQDNLLDVDQYLINQGLMQHFPRPETRRVLDYLQLNQAKSPNRDLLLKGRESYYLIKKLLDETKKYD
jgi:predicted glycosyltransferase